jgi:hypothetical protein
MDGHPVNLDKSGKVPSVPAIHAHGVVRNTYARTVGGAILLGVLIVGYFVGFFFMGKEIPGGFSVIAGLLGVFLGGRDRSGSS